jgi:hypothetical protein
MKNVTQVTRVLPGSAVSTLGISPALLKVWESNCPLWLHITHILPVSLRRMLELTLKLA